MAIDPKHIELSAEQKKALAEAADRTGKPWSDLLAEALQNYFPICRGRVPAEGMRSLFDVLEHDGAIGVVKDGLPHELSTNPKHMEGLGRDREADCDYN